MIGLLAIDYGQIAVDFIRDAGLDINGCKGTVRQISSGYSIDIKDGVTGDDSKYYWVTLDSKGRVTSALNYTLVHRRAKGMGGRISTLPADQARRKLESWAKKWPAPAGYTIRSFTPSTKYGDADLVYDRKIGDIWLGAAFQYSIDLRSGVMSRFFARYGNPGNTKLTVRKADAMTAAEAILGPAIKKYGAHAVASAKPAYVPRFDARDTFDLAYTVQFRVAKPSPKTQFYGGAIVYVHGATGKTFGGLQMLEYKGKTRAKDALNLP